MSDPTENDEMKAETDKLRAEVVRIGAKAQGGDPEALEMLETLEKSIAELPPGETVLDTAKRMYELGRLREKIDRLTANRETEPTEKASCPGPNKWELAEQSRAAGERQQAELRATEIAKNKLLIGLWETEADMKGALQEAYLKDVKSLIQWRSENTRILNSVAIAAQGFVKVVGLLAAAGEKVADRWRS